MLLLGQVQSNRNEDPVDIDARDGTVFQHVLRSNKERERLLYEARKLSDAIENTKDSTAAIRVYRELTHQRLERDVAQAGEQAASLSGARGFKARKTLTQLEEELSRASDK